MAEKIKSDSLSKTYTSLSFVLLPKDETEVERIIRNLRTDSAVGWDGISTKVLKCYFYKLVPVITHIFNCSIKSDCFPKALKKAVVHPIYKSGDRCSVNNYRPISILPSISKILEKILNSHIIKILENNKILAHNQNGFRNGKLTEDAVLSFVHQTVSLLNSGKKCLGIFLDITKAFDTVSVPHLLD